METLIQDGGLISDFTDDEVDAEVISEFKHITLVLTALLEGI